MTPGRARRQSLGRLLGKVQKRYYDLEPGLSVVVTRAPKKNAWQLVRGKGMWSG